MTTRFKQRIKGQVYKAFYFINKLSNLLYPRTCVECEQDIGSEERDAIFCASCATQLVHLSGPVCFVCSAPFVSEAATSHSPSHRCGECRENPPLFLKAITPFLYEGPLSTAICQFKYKKKPHLAAPLARLIANDLSNISTDYVMAIPLHSFRLRGREFNQSLLLARQIGITLSLPYFVDVMIRTRETPPQVGLSRKERDENIKGAFKVTQPNAIQDRRILLIDDVYTTGATLKEGARTLMRAGAKEVIVATIARMPAATF
ncbi:MAG: ComF family protein [Nitrospirae bacterium]|nr:ComF family protein [Candidatus Troglogloeales bacterium]